MSALLANVYCLQHAGLCNLQRLRQFDPRAESKQELRWEGQLFHRLLWGILQSCTNYGILLLCMIVPPMALTNRDVTLPYDPVQLLGLLGLMQHYLQAEFVYRLHHCTNVALTMASSTHLAISPLMPSGFTGTSCPAL